jgi:hypothetical protein
MDSITSLGRQWPRMFIHTAKQSVVRFVAFPAIEYDEVLSGYQPGQMVEQLSSEQTNVSKTISVLVLRVLV